MHRPSWPFWKRWPHVEQGKVAERPDPALAAAPPRPLTQIANVPVQPDVLGMPPGAGGRPDPPLDRSVIAGGRLRGHIADPRPGLAVNPATAEPRRTSLQPGPEPGRNRRPGWGALLPPCGVAVRVSS